MSLVPQNSLKELCPINPTAMEKKTTNEWERQALVKKTNHLNLTADTFGKHRALHLMVRCAENMERDGRREVWRSLQQFLVNRVPSWNPLLDQGICEPPENACDVFYVDAFFCEWGHAFNVIPE